MKVNETDLTFYTYGSAQKLDLFSPKKAIELLPNWFKTIDKTQTTLRTCPGFIDLFKDSICIPLWSDIKITYIDNQIKNIQMPGIPDDAIYQHIEQHHPTQWGEGFENSMHLKIKNAWYVKSDKMIPFLLHDATWHKNAIDEYSVLPGKLEFKAQHSCHINILLPRTNTEKTILLEAGTIIAYLTPMIDTNINIQTKLVTFEEWMGFKSYIFSFKNYYRKAKNIIQGVNI